MESHRAFEKWLREGRAPALEREAMAHVEECRACRDELAALDGLTSLYSREEELLSPREVAGIRFQLEAACRREPDHHEPLLRPWYLRSLWIPAGAFAMVLIIMSSLYLFVQRRSRPVTTEARERVQISASEGAVWRYLSQGKATVVAVDEGVVTFRVPSLQRTESFHVVAGDEWVEVRGTSFTVAVARKRLEKVNVTEGVVSVHAAGENRLLIREMSWVRPKAAGQQVALAGPCEGTLPGRALEGCIRKNQVKRTAPAMGGTPGMSPEETKNRSVSHAAPPVKRMPPETSMKSSASAPRTELRNHPPGSTSEKQPKQVLARRFAAAYRTLQSGNWRKAVGLFSSLYKEKGLGSKRADVLFWLAQAHLRGGHYAKAKKLLARFVTSYPSSWRAPDAKKQLELLKSN